LYINFRIFDSWKVDRLPVISVNYFVCILLGYGFSAGGKPISQQDIFSSWVILALILGFLFLCNFFLTGLTVEKKGLSVASIATKMSLVLPFVFSLVIHEGRGGNVYSFVGLAFAACAIWFVSGSGSKENASSLGFSWLPILIFFLTGLTDVLSQWSNESLVPSESRNLFVMFVFAGAFFGSLPVVVYQYVNAKVRINWLTLGAGVLLGVPNYFSYYMLLKALQEFNNEGNIVFPAGNLGVILMTGVTSFLFFKDPFTLRNLLGIIFSALSLGFLFIHFWF
jgi:drug/metabolite transporter (DMT)-like permease